MKTRLIAVLALSVATIVGTSSAFASLADPTNFASVFAGAQTYTFENPTDTPGDGTPGTGISVAAGITWHGTEDATIYGQTTPRDFNSNGTWDPSLSNPLAPHLPSDPGVSAFIALTDESDDESYMAVVFDTPVSGVGVFLSFNRNGQTWGGPSSPVLEVWGTDAFGFHALQTYDLYDDFDFNAYLDDNDPLALDDDDNVLPNQGFLFGITSDEANIVEFRLTGAHLAAARLYVNTVPEPEGIALTLTALGLLGASLRRRRIRD